MPSKRYHSKSRLGCRQCKSRRIRCDQNAPCCSNCAKKGIECDFKDLSGALINLRLFTPDSFSQSGHPVAIQQPSHSPDTKPQSHSRQHSRSDSRKLSASSASSRHGTSTSPCSTPGTSAGCSPAPINFTTHATSFSLEDMGLLHHFTLHTSQTLTPLETDEYCYIWQYEVPQLASSHPFLMHAMLSFAAAHQATCEPQQYPDRLQVARRHYSTALSLFRESVGEITSDQADPLLCFCILTSFLSLRLGFDRQPDQGDAIDEFLELLHTLQRAQGVLNQVQGSLHNSRIGSLLRHTRNQEQHYMSPEFFYSLSQLESMALIYTDPVAEPSKAAAIHDAMVRLRHFYTLSSPRPRSWAHLLSFPIGLGPSFSSLLEQRDKLALCVLAHWTVPAYNARSKWFSGDWPQRLMLAISQELEGDEWTDTMRWPLSDTLERDRHDFYAMDDLNTTVFSL